MSKPKSDTRSRSTMLAFAPTPTVPQPWDLHRPAASSPLSSSPMRVSSPNDEGTSAPRQTHSSPIQPPKFKFASHPVRSNPLLRKREEAQDSRRRNFLYSVRQKADDQAWQRRDIEGQYLRNSLLADVGRLSCDAPSFSEIDLEDAIVFQQQLGRQNEAKQQQTQTLGCDDNMVDFAGSEEKELDAMIASYEEQQAQEVLRPPSRASSDDEYEDLFAELLVREETLALSGQAPPSSSSAEQMDMS